MQTFPNILGLVSFKVFPASMGGQKGVALFYKHLAAHTRCALAVTKGDAAETGFPATVYPVLAQHKKSWGSIGKLGTLRKIIHKEQTDYIIAEHSYTAWLAFILRWMTGIPFCIHLHNIETHRFRDMGKPLWRLYGLYEGWILRRANHLFFITDEEMNRAISQWRLDTRRCTRIPYGTTEQSCPDLSLQQNSRAWILQACQLSTETRIYLFNGSLDYLPNIQALETICTEILPRLKKSAEPFIILVCGSRLSQAWVSRLNSTPGVHYLGFVSNFDTFVSGADCFLNPIMLGAGMKTKLIDALSANCYCVSTAKGAEGISKELADARLAITPDGDWDAFTDAMLHPLTDRTTSMPVSFYQFYHWNTIVKKALLSLSPS